MSGDDDLGLDRKLSLEGSVIIVKASGTAVSNLVGKSLAILLFGLVLPFTTKAQTDLTTLVKRVRSSIVTIVTFNSKGKGLSQGTGFFTSTNGTLITNYHVIKGFHHASIKTNVLSKQCRSTLRTI
jgi:S1-C subfamily serine protease